MAADVLVPGVTRTSATMILNMQDNIFDSSKSKDFQLTV